VIVSSNWFADVFEKCNSANTAGLDTATVYAARQSGLQRSLSEAVAEMYALLNHSG